MSTVSHTVAKKWQRFESRIELLDSKDDVPSKDLRFKPQTAQPFSSRQHNLTVFLSFPSFPLFFLPQILSEAELKLDILLSQPHECWDDSILSVSYSSLVVKLIEEPRLSSL